MKRAAMTVLVTGLLAAAGAYGSAFLPGATPVWAAPLLGCAAVATMLGAALLATARPGGEALAAWLAVGGVALGFGMVSVWTIPPVDPASPRLLLGLPPRAAHLLYGMGLAPALVVPLLYAWTFRGAVLSEEDLERVRAAVRGGGEDRGPGAAERPADAPGAADQGPGRPG